MRKTLTVKAGPHERRCCPVSCELTKNAGAVTLTEVGDGKPVACQIGEGRLHWVVEHLPASGEKSYLLEDKPAVAGRGIEMKSEKNRVEVLLTGAPMATYRHGKEEVRPFLNPVIGPTGVSVVRELFLRGDGVKEHDHFHHKGILVAHGDVNGTDNWSEEPNHGRQIHTGFRALDSGPVFGRIAATNDWVSKSGAHLLLEDRDMIFWNVGDDARIIDFRVTFRADTQDVTFGDTKEGGILSIRVPTPLRVDKGGRMESAVGGIGEKECWGRRSHWCDYSGKLASQTVGIAVFDHRLNFRHPTYWHIRDYGLYAANPFALSYYYGDKTRNGAHTVRKGESFCFAYRVHIHTGDAASGRVAEAYHNYANPPQIEEVPS